MLLLLIQYLTQIGVKVPAAFNYSSTRMLLAALTALLITLFLGPRVIKKLYELKVGQTIGGIENCPMLAELHEKKRNTPTMGGILILLSMAVSLLLWMDWKSPFTLLLFVTTVCLGGMGAYDDYLKMKYKSSKGLTARRKLLFQIALGGLVAAYTLSPMLAEKIHMGDWFEPPTAKVEIQKGRPVVAKSLTLQEYSERYFVPFVKDPVVILGGGFLLLAFFITIFVITGSSNAVNLTDGLDGLATGCIILVSLVLGLFAFLSNHVEIARYLNIPYIEGSAEIGIYLFSMIGACLGFLWYNGYPAQVFMGDTGSLAMGGILGVSAVLLRREGLLALVGGIFVAEALSVILQVLSYKFRDKKRIFLCAPLHHHFEYKGWPETKVVLRFWIIGLILAVLGVISLKLQ